MIEDCLNFLLELFPFIVEALEIIVDEFQDADAGSSARMCSETLLNFELILAARVVDSSLEDLRAVIEFYYDDISLSVFETEFEVNFVIFMESRLVIWFRITFFQVWKSH
ncbi:hypothetical protein BV898_17918 [Hypsibius exemplaris]|uniref:Uncharacterized protein n=1 Tax=Hypsibius exemplaris TaxID=2072580 RepID=A0A9X6NIV1_HYPEX|nr:hypothetical protein BV898_17918 [Hypsibius exemplaris]